MNFASWVILAIVIVVMGLAVRATFFRKKKGGCCDTGDPMENSSNGCSPAACANCSCTSCHVKVEIKPLE